jgi:hypothetical protein
METGFLTSWQGVVSVALVGSMAIAALLIITKNIDKLKGMRIGRDGVRFDGVNLSLAIPRIDNNTKVRLQSLVKDITDIARANIDLSGYSFKCMKSPESCVVNSTGENVLKMLLVSRLVIPLYDSINQNHLVKMLNTDNVDGWIRRISKEILFNFKVIEDYCDIDLPDERLPGSIDYILRNIFVPKARTILIDTVFNKTDVYGRIEKDEKHKEELLEKSGKYLKGLEA